MRRVLRALGRLRPSGQALDQAFGVAFGRPLGARSRLGIGAKLIRSQIGQDSASSLAFDLGVMHRISRWPVSLGLAVQNLGPGMKFISQRDPLPLSVTAGLAYSLLPGMNLALDAKRLVYDRETHLSVGTEYQIFGALALRGGYTKTGYGVEGIGDSSVLGGLAGGVGLKFLGTQVDYAITPFGALGNAHRISLTARF